MKLQRKETKLLKKQSDLNTAGPTPRNNFHGSRDTQDNAVVRRRRRRGFYF